MEEDRSAQPSSAKILAIWRHPVKSLRGEPLERADIDGSGLRCDRGWGIRDGATGRIITARREPRLLEAAAALAADDQPDLTLPDGTVVHGPGDATDAALSRWLGRPVSLAVAAEDPGGRAEFFADPTDDSSEAIEWTMPVGRYVDAAPLLILTTASLRAGTALLPEGAWDVRRFRPNLVVDVDGDDWVEDSWCGRTVRVGDAELVPSQPCMRCTMVTRPQSELGRDLDIYRTVARHHDGTFGVWTGVQRAGTVRIGDPVELVG